MGYIGSQPATNFETVRKQVSTTNSGTTITLDYSVSSVQDILVTVNAVVQSYDNYSVSGTTLTLGGTLNNDRVEILYVGRTFQTVTPATGTVNLDMLSATGTKDATTFLRGDNTFATAGGDNTPAFNVKLSSNQDVSDGVGTVVAFNSEQVDTDNAFNTSTYRFIPQTAGKYFISFTMYALSANAGNGNLISMTAHIRKNGSNQTQVVNDYNNSFIRQGVATTTAIIDMNGSSDYIDFFGDVNVGTGDGRFENHTRANGFLLIGA